MPKIIKAGKVLTSNSLNGEIILSENIRKQNELDRIEKDALREGKITSVESQLAEKANDSEVRKTAVKLKLEDADADFLGAIAGTGTFNLLSIPQDSSVSTLKLDAGLKSKFLQFVQLANTVFMRSGMDVGTISLVNPNTVEYTTNTTYGMLGLAVANTLGDKYKVVTTVTNIGTALANIKRLITYNNSLLGSASSSKNGVQYTDITSLAVGGSVTFDNDFLSAESAYTAIALSILSITNGAHLRVTQRVYNLTTTPDETMKAIDWVNLSTYTNKADIASTALKANKLEESYKNSLIDYSADAISCFGDSLTRGVGGSIPFPQTLATLTGKTVYNMGIGGESTINIATRQGSRLVWVNNLTIPAGLSPVTIGNLAQSNILDDFGYDIKFLLQGGGVHPSVNPCTIAGIEGTLAWTGATPTDSAGIFTFTRLVAGNPLTLTRPTKIETYASKVRRENMTIFWTGTNDALTSANVQEMILKQRVMIDYLKTKKYIIVGMTSKYYMPEVVAINDALRKEYGCKFLDIRKYILAYGLADAGITATTQDTTDITNGEIPLSLRFDAVHLNDAGYEIVAEQLYIRGKELGYWS